MTVRKTIDVYNPSGVKTINLEYETTCFRDNPVLRSKGVENHQAVIYLVMFNQGKVYVDERAPQWYQELAALHEIICCGKQHEEICELSGEPIRRCSEVENVVLMNAGEHRSRYIYERARMLDFISDHNLVSLEMRPMINYAKHSLIELTWVKS